MKDIIWNGYKFDKLELIVKEMYYRSSYRIGYDIY